MFAPSGRSGRGQTLLDYALTQALANGGALVIALCVGPASYALLRLAQIPMAAVQVVMTGVTAVVQPRLVGLVTRGRFYAARRLTLGSAVVLVLCIAASGLLATILPSSLMVRVLGGEWPAARQLVWLVGLSLIGATVGATVGPLLRAVGAINAQIVARIYVTPVAMAAIFAAAEVGGVPGGIVAQGAAGVVLGGIMLMQAQKAVGFLIEAK